MENYNYMPGMMNMPPCMMQQNQYMMTPDFYERPQMPMSTGLEPYTYHHNLSDALKSIQEAVTGEAEDRKFYQYLIDNAPSNEDKEIITGIRDDEIKHFSLFRQVYYQLTGQMLPQTQDVTFQKPASYCAGIKKALLGEQNAVRKYRRILFALQDRVQINILTEIITDEIRHGSLYNYLFTKNGCKV
ncbi:MAG: ferritin-like domain-containing protein [Ruminiclostridium sp.]|nr:ferritin-like domain-containing protein [Ruminiclostridium sp.]